MSRIRREMPASEAVAWAQQGNEAFVPSSAGDTLRWRISRNDLVIDRPPRSVYDMVTADEGVGGSENPDPKHVLNQLPLL